MNKKAIQAGDIIILRQRLWRVDRLYKNEMQATAIDSYETQQRRFYLPLEKYEKLTQVLPGENQIGDPANQALYLQAEKLYMLHGSSPFVSLQKSSIIPTNYQLVPVVMALRELPPEAYSEDDKSFIKPRVLELVYTSHSLREFAQDAGYEAEPFGWDEERRANLKAELDAYYAHLYGLSRDELLYILDPEEIYGKDFSGETFRVLKNKEMNKYGEYRTKRLVMEKWDEMFAKV